MAPGRQFALEATAVGIHRPRQRLLGRQDNAVDHHLVIAGRHLRLYDILDGHALADGAAHQVEHFRVFHDPVGIDQAALGIEQAEPVRQAGQHGLHQPLGVGYLVAGPLRVELCCFGRGACSLELFAQARGLIPGCGRRRTCAHAFFYINSTLAAVSRR